MDDERPQNTAGGGRGLTAVLPLAGLVAALAVAGCATAPDPNTDPEAYQEFVETNDPLEPFNRAVFKFNQGLDTMLLTPLAIFYRDILPPIFTEGVDNVLANLRSPVVFINDLLQAQPERAGDTLARFLVNSTIGVGGLMDPATKFGIPAHNEDFGQTLAVWGLGEGPYLVLPLFGPSNPRDATGLAIDSIVIDPFGFLGALVFDYGDTAKALTLTRSIVTGLSQRARTLETTDELERSSLDFYAAVRSAFRQNRRFEIDDGRIRVPEVPPKPDDANAAR